MNQRINVEWISVKDKLPPKDSKFLFSYFYGIGLGQYGQCYEILNGNSERTHNGYILILWPTEILDGSSPMTFEEDQMIEMEMHWMPLPYRPDQTCQFCDDPNSILSKETCCTGCSKFKE